MVLYIYFGMANIVANLKKWVMGRLSLSHENFSHINLVLYKSVPYTNYNNKKKKY